MATSIGNPALGPQPQPDPSFAAWVIERFYTGDGTPCPIGCGGEADVVRVGTLDDGCGELWLECGSCAQRGRFEAPSATADERAAVEAALRGGVESLCPRHGRRVPLQRRGRQLVCPECGVRYRG